MKDKEKESKIKEINQKVKKLQKPLIVSKTIIFSAAMAIVVWNTSSKEQQTLLSDKNEIFGHEISYTSSFEETEVMPSKNYPNDLENLNQLLFYGEFVENENGMYERKIAKISINDINVTNLEKLVKDNNLEEIIANLKNNNINISAVELINIIEQNDISTLLSYLENVSIDTEYRYELTEEDINTSNKMQLLTYSYNENEVLIHNKTEEDIYWDRLAYLLNIVILLGIPVLVGTLIQSTVASERIQCIKTLKREKKEIRK